jgi:hypothetical protein
MVVATEVVEPVVPPPLLGADSLGEGPTVVEAAASQAVTDR